MRNAIALLLLIALTICTPAEARKKKATWKKGYTQNDWSVGYGYKSIMTISDGFKDIEMSDVTKLTVTADNRKSIGAISFGYTHRKGKLVSFGLQAAFELTKEDCMINNKTWAIDGTQVDHYSEVGELTNRYITVTPLLRFNWADYCDGKLNIYSKIAAGITFIGDSYTNQSELTYSVTSKKQHYFGFQVSPIGIQYDKKAGFFIEAGFGSYGIAQAGFCYHF